MRLFKYKIWDIPNKKWVGIPYALTQFGDLLCKGMVFKNMSDFEVCRFTGRRDYKNKEIYEGHILKDDSNIYIIRFGNYKANNNKSYSNEPAYGFYIEYISHKGVIDHATRIEYGTIIGNEFENPELLKEAE